MALARDARILVVGAGPVGLTAALELARRGYRPRIIDMDASLGPVAESRALAVNARTLELLEPSGATADILAEAIVIREMRLFARGRRLATIDAMDTDHRFRGLHSLPQGRTERILAARLAGFGIEPEWNTRLVGLENFEAPVATIERDGKSEAREFDLVVGTDGAHSSARKAAGFAFPGEALSETFHLADFNYDCVVAADHAEAHFQDPGIIARLPVGPRTLRWVSTFADFEWQIAHPAPVADTPWRSTFKVSFRHVADMSRGRVFLAGDAAHIHSPIGGRGMNLGIEDACWLAWLVEEGREADYSALRMPAVRLVMGETRRTTRMVLLQNPLLRLLRNFALPLLARTRRVRQEGLKGVLGLDTPPPPWLKR